MERTDGPSVPCIKNDLLSGGRGFSFFQALRLLRHILDTEDRQEGGCLRLRDIPPSRLKIRPHLSLAFPGAGVERIEETDHGAVTLTTNILGLYGTGSPLPTFYTEDLIGDTDQGEKTVRDFIDVINHRLYHLLFEAWTKYKSMIKVLEEKDTVIVQRFYNIIGMDELSLGDLFENPRFLLKYSGLFAMSSRPASGLETLLADALRVPVRVIQMVARKGIIPEDQRCRLGQNIRLGLMSSLGKEVNSSNGAFRIEIGPLTGMDYRRLSPGEPAHRKLVSLTGLYVPSPLDYDVDLIMDKKEKPQTACLGAERYSRLGLDTWVFSDHGPDEFRTRFYPVGLGVGGTGAM